MQKYEAHQTYCWLWAPHTGPNPCSGGTKWLEYDNNDNNNDRIIIILIITIITDKRVNTYLKKISSWRHRRHHHHQEHHGRRRQPPTHPATQTQFTLKTPPVLLPSRHTAHTHCMPTQHAPHLEHLHTRFPEPNTRECLKRPASHGLTAAGSRPVGRGCYLNECGGHDTVLYE